MDDDFLALRRYTRLEAALLLSVPKTWIKDWVTQRCIPMQRSGTCRGVWFTRADILAIGGMLPELMSGRQANARVRQDARAVLAFDQDRYNLSEAAATRGVPPEGVPAAVRDLTDGIVSGEPGGLSAGGRSQAARHHPVGNDEAIMGMLRVDGMLDLSKFAELRSVRSSG